MRSLALNPMRKLMKTSETSRSSSRRYRHAIVAGGSIAGLLAARVLAAHFERVTLIERDTLAPSPAPRPGVPQGRHLHALLVRGRAIVETLFPGITQDLREAGATLLNAGHQLAWHHAGGWRTRSDMEFGVLCMSRPLLESHIAGRVRALPNVTVLDATRIRGLTSDNDGRITGVRVRGTEDADDETQIAADLVVDALGRGSPMARWAQELGFAVPRTELLPARVAYATCMFHRPPTAAPRAMLVTGAPERCSGGIFPIEGGRWLMTQIGFFDEPMPRTHEECHAFARSLPAPDLAAFIRDLEPASDVVSYRFAGSQRRRFERVDHPPGGLIAVGDAVCSFNPVYGQGMTVSAIEAEALDGLLAEADPAEGFGPAFVRSWFDRITPIVKAAWDGVSLEDLRFPQLAARRPIAIRPLQWYMGRVHKATHHSPAVTTQFYRVMNFLDSPATLFRPAIAADVLFGRRRSAAADPAQDRRRVAPPELWPSKG
jgi:2-polyprenyl-6-methoxyphenol hydroxylase-like FAD-dependent oxidoreductase